MQKTKNTSWPRLASKLLALTAGLIALSGAEVQCGGPPDPLTIQTICTTIEQSSDRYGLTGTIDEVTITKQEFNEPTDLRLETNKEIKYHIELFLKADRVGGELKGTAEVTWSYHAYNVDKATCEDGSNVIQYRDYDDRSWTVNITGDFLCTTVDGQQSLGVSGSGTPDGSEVPAHYRLHENCTTFTREADDDARATWNGFSETGFQLRDGVIAELIARYDLPLPPDTTGERYRDVNLAISDLSNLP